MAPFWQEEQPARFVPDFEVKETKEGFLFKADVPGIKEKDLEVTMTGDRLTITGKREAASAKRR
jgi:HSP20 family protein